MLATTADDDVVPGRRRHGDHLRVGLANALPLCRWPGRCGRVVWLRSRFFRVAPRAVLMPYRGTARVVQVFDSDVATAVRLARATGCPVVLMSLGGRGFFGLRDAVREVIDGG